MSRTLHTVFILALLLHPGFARSAVDEQHLQVLLAQNNVTQVIKQIATLPKSEQNRAEILFIKGIALIQGRRFAQAITHHLDFIRKYPQLPEPYINLASVYAQTGNLRQAEIQLIQAINTNQSYAIALRNLRNIYDKLAAEAYRNALDQESQSEINLNNTQFVLIRNLPSWRQALVATEPAIEIAVASESAAQNPVTSGTSAIGNGGDEKPITTGTAATQQISETTVEPNSPVEPNTTVAESEIQTSIPTSDHEEQIDASLEVDPVAVAQAWAKSWSEKNVERYLSYYSAEFKPNKGLTRQAWEAQRRRRIENKSAISVKLSQLQHKQDGELAQVLFLQSYKSNNFNSNAHKRLDLSLEQGNWKIINEQVIKP